MNTMNNTSISLGSCFDRVVINPVSAGRYKNLSEVVRAGLRLLEDEESKVISLKAAIKKELESPHIKNLDFGNYLKSEKRKAKKGKNC